MNGNSNELPDSLTSQDDNKEQGSKNTQEMSASAQRNLESVIIDAISGRKSAVSKIIENETDEQKIERVLTYLDQNPFGEGESLKVRLFTVLNFVQNQKQQDGLKRAFKMSLYQVYFPLFIINGLQGSQGGMFGLQFQNHSDNIRKELIKGHTHHFQLIYVIDYFWNNLADIGEFMDRNYPLSNTGYDFYVTTNSLFLSIKKEQAKIKFF